MHTSKVLLLLLLFLPTVPRGGTMGLQMDFLFFYSFTPPTFGCKDDLSMWRRRNTSYSYYSSFSTPLTFQITWNMGPVSQMRSCSPPPSPLHHQLLNAKMGSCAAPCTCFVKTPRRDQSRTRELGTSNQHTTYSATNNTLISQQILCLN